MPMLSDKISAGSNSAMIPEQIVGRDGGITVPYAGRIPVVGLTTRAVQDVVEKALDGKAIQPQVLVDDTRPLSNTVSVGGEVAAGARVPVSVGGDRLMEVIDAAGGVRAPVNETFVELSRGKVTTRMPLSQVIADPKENIYLRPGDVVTLVRDPQTFIAYGATGRNAEIPFDADGVTLAQSLSKAGGLIDERADPQGVFIFRYETERVASALRPDSPIVNQGSPTPIVYRLDLRDPNSLFVEQRFQVRSRDLIYVSDAPLTEVGKFLQIIGGGLGIAGSGASIVSAASEAHWRLCPPSFKSVDQSEADHARDDQERRDDVVEQPRHDQNENAGDERNDGLQVADAEGHRFVLEVTGRSVYLRDREKERRSGGRGRRSPQYQRRGGRNRRSRGKVVAK